MNTTITAQHIAKEMLLLLSPDARRTTVHTEFRNDVLQYDLDTFSERLLKPMAAALNDRIDVSPILHTEPFNLTKSCYAAVESIPYKNGYRCVRVVLSPTNCEAIRLTVDYTIYVPGKIETLYAAMQELLERFKPCD